MSKKLEQQLHSLLGGNPAEQQGAGTEPEPALEGSQYWRPMQWLRGGLARLLGCGGTQTPVAPPPRLGNALRHVAPGRYRIEGLDGESFIEITEDAHLPVYELRLREESLRQQPAHVRAFIGDHLRLRFLGHIPDASVDPAGHEALRLEGGDRETALGRLKPDNTIEIFTHPDRQWYQRTDIQKVLWHELGELFCRLVESVPGALGRRVTESHERGVAQALRLLEERANLPPGSLDGEGLEQGVPALKLSAQSVRYTLRLQEVCAECYRRYLADNLLQRQWPPESVGAHAAGLRDAITFGCFTELYELLRDNVFNGTPEDARLRLQVGVGADAAKEDRGS